MQKVLGELIGPAKGIFILKRLIQDNIVLMQGVVHSLRKKRTKKKWTVLKFDFEKPMIRFDGILLRPKLKEAGFPKDWMEWIEEYVLY